MDTFFHIYLNVFKWFARNILVLVLFGPFILGIVISIISLPFILIKGLINK